MKYSDIDRALLISLGKDVAKREFHSGPQDDESFYLKATQWLERNRTQLKAKIESNEGLKNAVYNQKEEKIVATAIVDAIGNTFLGVAGATLAMIIAQYGVDRFLNDDDES